MSLLGLDVGTTGCKAVVFDLDGQIIAQAYREYPLEYPQPGWIELDADLVWKGTAEVIREVGAETKSDPVEALAVSSLGEAVVPVDEKGNSLSRSIIGFDSRFPEIVPWWEEKLGKEAIFQITGMPLNETYTIAKIQWFKAKQPDIYHKTRKFLCYEDFTYMKLGLSPTIDYSLAARTMAFDVNEKQWSQRILGCAGVDSKLLAEVKPSGDIIGEIPEEIASDLNLPKGVKVVTGGHDQPCGALGAGIIEPRLAMYATGTVECIAPAFSQKVLNEQMLKSNFCCYPHTKRDMYTTVAFNFTGGSLFRWFRDTFGYEEKLEAQKTGRDPYDILTQKAVKEPTRIFVLPHFTTTGTPYFDAKSKGSILGLTLGTTKAEIIKAILEGVTYEMKFNFELLRQAGIEINELRAIGGGAKSTVWTQLKADMLGTKVVRLEVSEAACLGAAILAGIATGKYESFESACQRVVKMRDVILPDEEKKSIYAERFEIYQRIYPTIKPLNHLL